MLLVCAGLYDALCVLVLKPVKALSVIIRFLALLGHGRRRHAVGAAEGAALLRAAEKMQRGAVSTSPSERFL